MIRRNTPKRVACAAPLLLAASLSFAQTSETFIQNAKTFGGGNSIHMYGLPVKTPSGLVSYWDLTMVLEADDVTGKPKNVSLSDVVKSPKLRKSEFIPGNYIGSSDFSCTLTAVPSVGRNQYDLRCSRTGTTTFVARWYTGKIAGHPYEAELLAAKLDTVVGSDEYSWGKNLTNSGGTYFGCFDAQELFYAQQIGDRLTLMNYGNDSNFDCQTSFAFLPTGQ